MIKFNTTIKRKGMVSKITVLEISTTIREVDKLSHNTMLKCQCGWYGKIKCCPKLRHFTHGGALLKEQYLCRNSLHILGEIRYKKAKPVNQLNPDEHQESL